MLSVLCLWLLLLSYLTVASRSLAGQRERCPFPCSEQPVLKYSDLLNWTVILLCWGGGLSSPGWSRSTQWCGLLQMHSLLGGPQPPLVYVVIIAFLYLNNFPVLKNFFFKKYSGFCFFQLSKESGYFLFSCCSSPLFLTFADNRMCCLVLIKWVEKLQMWVGNLMLSACRIL